MPNAPCATIFPSMTTQAAREARSLSLLVNGDRRTVADGTTLSAFLTALALDPRLVVVERNRVILRDRSSYADIVLNDGDVLEIVHFVGGG